ncbi:hypothetical protein D3C72_1545590 [compost metagenome]
MKSHMLDRPYIKDVIKELEKLGFKGDSAKDILIKYYRVLKRSIGFNPNACNFAEEIRRLDIASRHQHDTSDSDRIYIGHLRVKIKNK